VKEENAALAKAEELKDIKDEVKKDADAAEEAVKEEKKEFQQDQATAKAEKAIDDAEK
jgi:hypothetical protein